ncbi:MAG: hypothetical protein KDA22_09670 [Phycisphaerales bacterium]|nr:hypothetical protein [Phycisphaerales bacterium]
MNRLAILVAAVAFAAPAYSDHTPGSTPGRNADPQPVPVADAPVAAPMKSARRAPVAPVADGALPSGNAVVSAFIDAVGGIDRIRTVPGLRSTAVLDGSAGNIESRSLSAPGNRFLITRTNATQGTVSVGSDGTIAWIAADSGACRLLAPEETHMHADSSDPLAMIRAFPERYGEFHTIGREAFAGAECIRIGMIDQSGQPVNAWFGADDALLKGLRFGDEAEPTVVRFDDWGDVAGLRLFARMSVDRGESHHSIRWTALEIDPIDAVAFAAPSEAARLARQDAEQRAAASEHGADGNGP